MLKLKKIAVTGGLASGKSSVCRIFKELGASVVSADEIVHQLLSSETNTGQEVIKLLGPDIVEGGQQFTLMVPEQAKLQIEDPLICDDSMAVAMDEEQSEGDGSVTSPDRTRQRELLDKHKGPLDRGKIANKVFGNPKLLQSLENILHPAVREEIEKKYQQTQTLGRTTLFVAEVPLLFEAGFTEFDATIAVIANEKICKQRFKDATGYDQREFENRMSRQLSIEEKARRAKFVINNEGSLDDLRRAVISIYNKLLKMELNPE